MTNPDNGTDKGAKTPRPLIEIPFYPVLMGAYLPMNLLAPNLGVFSLPQGTRSVIALALVGLLLLAVSYLFIRRIHYAALSSAIVIGTVWAMMVDETYGRPFFLIAAAIFFLLWRTDLGHRATRVMNVFALAIFVQPIVFISADYIRVQNNQSTALDYSPFYTSEFVVNTDRAAPNIVHIVLDGYASREILSSEFSFDNSEFETSLKNMGFMIGSDVRTPHDQTVLVLASIYGGTYLDTEKYPMQEEDSDRLRVVLGQVVSNGPLKKRLGELDYSFLAAESGYYFFKPAEGDILTGPAFGMLSLDFFEQELAGRLLTTLPQAVADKVGLAYFQSRKFNAYLRNAITADIFSGQAAPFHYFLHLIAPHPPFVIDRNGDTTDKWVDDFGLLADADHATLANPDKQAAYKAGYLEKLLYVNNTLPTQLEKMIADIPSPKVIIIHGDHGSGASFSQIDKSLACLKDRYSPFLAVYSDDPEINAAFNTIESERFNLVNLYRVLSNASFDTSLELLEDKTWYTSWGNPRHPVLLSDHEIETSCQ